jgi:hypothetical protein
MIAQALQMQKPLYKVISANRGQEHEKKVVWKAKTNAIEWETACSFGAFMLPATAPSSISTFTPATLCHANVHLPVPTRRSSDK